MIASVVSEYKWPPDVIGGLFIDSQDYEGLEFWYDQVVTANEELEKLKKK